MTLRGLVRDVVAEAAPGEVPFIAALDRLSDAQVSHRLARGAKQRDPLGFGTGDVVVLAVPVLWAAVNEVVQRMSDSFADSLLRRARDAVRRLLRRPRPPAPLPRFDEGQRAEVHRVVLRKAGQAGLDPGLAALLADSVVGRLALAASTERQDQTP